MILNLAHAIFKILIWPDSNYLIHRNLPPRSQGNEEGKLKCWSRKAGISIKCTNKRLSRQVT